MEKMRVLYLDDMLLVLSSLALKMTFQDVFGWLISDWAQTIFPFVELAMCFYSISLYVHSVLILLHSSPLSG